MAVDFRLQPHTPSTTSPLHICMPVVVHTRPIHQGSTCACDDSTNVAQSPYPMSDATRDAAATCPSPRHACLSYERRAAKARIRVRSGKETDVPQMVCISALLCGKSRLHAGGRKSFGRVIGRYDGSELAKMTDLRGEEGRGGRCVWYA